MKGNDYKIIIFLQGQNICEENFANFKTFSYFLSLIIVFVKLGGGAIADPQLHGAL